MYNNGKLQAGWGGSLFARAAEIIRYTGRGLVGHRRRPLRDDAPQRLPCRWSITGWTNGANWMMTFAEATIAIGVFTNDRATFDAGRRDVAEAGADDDLRHRATAPLPKPPSPSYDTAAELKALWHQPDLVRRPASTGETLRDHQPHVAGPGRDVQRGRDRCASRASTCSVRSRRGSSPATSAARAT